LARNLIFVSKMSDVHVLTMFEKKTCNMVQGTMVLMRGFWNANLYKLLGSTISNGCNSYVVLEGENEEDKTLTIYREKTMMWHKKL
jgi:hypothetical protein